MDGDPKKNTKKQFNITLCVTVGTGKARQTRPQETGGPLLIKTPHVVPSQHQARLLHAY